MSVRFIIPLFLLSHLSLVANADTVHLYECQSLDGVLSTNAIRSLDTGRRYLSSTAPSRSGWIFTHWTISTKQDFSDRDVWGRAYDVVPISLYEDTTLTAHYVPASRDTDSDSVADGCEIYWYGDLDETATSDTDGDGKTFAEELAAGTNPLLPQDDVEGPIRYADGALWQYNPLNKPAYTLRCEPEGALFATKSEIVAEGTKITTGAYQPKTTSFACWKVNGVEQRDVWGRAKDSITLAMPTNAVEIVAIVSTGDSDGDGIADNIEHYWYGDLDETATSDSDSDGRTFAEELSAGTNPLLPQWDVEGPVRYVVGALHQYNPYGLQPYTLKCDPEDSFFATTNFYVKQGTKVTTGTYGTANGFAYWKFNGVAQRDAWGRALDSITFTMPTSAVELVVVKVSGDSDGDGIADNVEHYWYGDLNEAAESDTDGDGQTFAEELAAGTNPLLAQSDVSGHVLFADGELFELNLQPYEQSSGTLVDYVYTQLFYSPILGNDATSVTFGVFATPYIADLNNDGLFDLIVTSSATTNVFLNVGSSGSPAFVATNGLSLAAVDWGTNDVAQLKNLSLDVAAPADALSCAFGDANQDGVDDLLVSDSEGRIWLYQGTQGTEATEGTSAASAGASTGQGESSLSSLGSLKSLSYSLQHKVWGGTYAGFASGLRIAVVDWDADGDLDCLCGTAEGKLMLLLDPSAGRPTGLVADAGVDSVNLSWNASSQSRVRGYRVYRSLSSLSSFESLGSSTLPAYRDVPAEEGDYAYRVTSLSRSYVAGNSEPVITESKPSESVSARYGTAQFHWRLVNEGDAVNAQLIVRNSSGLASNLQLKITFDSSVLVPKSSPFVAGPIAPTFAPTVTKSGSDALIVSGTLTDVVADQSGELFSLAFTLLPAADFAKANLVVIEFTITTEGGGTKIDLGDTTQGGSGDVNFDGVVDEADVTLMKELIKKSTDAIDTAILKAGDLNGDSKLNAKDLLLLKRKVAVK